MQQLYPFEEAAVRVEVVLPDGERLPAWLNRSTRDMAFLEESPPPRSHNSEWHARYRAYSDQPCPTEDCTGRAPKNRTVCDVCFGQSLARKWAEFLPKAVDWDGKFPFCLWDDDKFFFNEGDFYDYIEQRIFDYPDTTLESLRLTTCEPDNGQHFDMQEFLCDSLPEHDPYPSHDFDTIDKIVNEWIKENAPFSWHGTQTPIKPESVRALVADLLPAPALVSGETQ